MENDPKEKFTGRAGDYALYRPHYPHAILEPLRRQCGFSSQSAVADIACGTGLLAEVFLRNGNAVIGVEPNDAMRRAGEEYLRDWREFRSVDASAEATMLPDGSVDFVTVGQAFHWIDSQHSRVEFARILRPRAWVVLVWNQRITSGDSFNTAYHELLCHHCGGEHAVAGRRTTDEQIREFFAPNAFAQHNFPNSQRLDWNGLKGRLLSSSYAPAAGQLGHEPMIADLARIFREHQCDGHIVLDYKTEVFYGRLHP
jgi:ubiquinone/menaquinone biosynthesis C-methylase UbiE